MAITTPISGTGRQRQAGSVITSTRVGKAVAAERRHEQELTRDNDEILCTLNAISKLFLNLHYISDFMVSIGKSCFDLI